MLHSHSTLRKDNIVKYEFKERKITYLLENIFLKTKRTV